MAHPTFPGISRMKSVMVVWLYSAEQYRQHTLLLEIAEHAAHHGFNDAPVDVLVLHGHEFVPPGDIARLREWNFHVRDVSATYAPIAARFPGLRARYSNHFFECFLRWLVIKEVCGGAPVLAWDADIFFNEALSVLHGAYAGATFTSSSTCFVALSDPAWLATYERELLAFERDPASAIDGIRSALTARLRIDPSSFESSFFGPLIAAALPSTAEWTRLFDSTPEELFVDHLVRMGRLPHAVRPEVARYVLCAQPLLPTPRAWVHPFGAGLPADAAATWSHDGRQYWSGERPLAFVHFQGALFRACAVHQLLGDVLGEATLLHDAFYCAAERRRGHAVADVFFRDRAAWVARAEARHGAILHERWGDLFSERDVARRYVLRGALTGVLQDHGRPVREGLDQRAHVAEWLDGPIVEIAWDTAGTASLSTEGQARHRGRLPIDDASVEVLCNFGSLGTLRDGEVEGWAREMRRVVRRAVWLSLEATPERDRTWWETRLLSVGLRKHPRQMDVVPYDALEDEGPRLTLLLEPIPAAALATYPLEALRDERDLHMDMSRESGRRADAHIARYVMARRYLPTGGVVLDAACGLGYGAAVLACDRPDVRILGIDSSEYAVAYAQASFEPTYPNAQFRVGDACRLDHVADESVDLVVSFETVEHLPDPDRFLAEVQRVLKPEGRFICSVPNQWVDEDGRDPNPWHFHVFDYRALANLCSRFFAPEHVYRQTAGGGMTLHDAPRALEPVNFPVREGAQDAEWWLAVGRKVAVRRPVGPREAILALTADPAHPHFASWLPMTGRPVRYLPETGVDIEFPADVALVVATDCYHEPNVTLLQRAMELGLPVLILADGVLEYRNTWEHPQLVPGSLFQPVLGTRIACLGRGQARILESWGNGDRCEIVGAPRFDRYATLQRRERPLGAPARVLVMTALTPAFTDAQLALVRQSLTDVQAALQGATDAAGAPVEIVWRLTHGLDAALGVENLAGGLAGRELADVLQGVDAVISTPSTSILESMLLGLPTATLDYCNAPAYVHTAWRITAPMHIGPALTELLAPSAARMLYQDTMLHDALECATPAGPRMVELVERMIVQASRGEQGVSGRLLPAVGHLPSPTENALDPARLYPGHDPFTTRDRRALQVEVGHLRHHAARLEALVHPDADRTHRLLADFAQAERLVGRAEQAAIWDVTIGTAPSRALFLNPPAALRVRVPTQDGGRFVSAIALHPDVWDNPEAGACEFVVRVNDRVALVTIIDPVTRTTDRRWIDIMLDIPPNPQGAHVIRLETRGIGSDSYRWALWRDPRFISSRSDRLADAPTLIAAAPAGGR